MSETIARLNVDIGATLKGFDKALSGLEGRLNKFAAGLGSIGKSLTRNVSVPLALAGGAAVKYAATFDQAMSRSTAIMGEAGQTMRAELEATARTVARDAVQSSAEVAESYYFLASAGLDASQSMAALPQVVKFATAGNFDLATATDLATDAQSALGLTVRDATQNLENLVRVTDVLTKANTLANASSQQFSEALTNRAGAALRLVGKEIEEGVAVLAAWADQGVKGAEAGTRLDIVLRDLQKAAQDAKFSNKEFYQGVYDLRGEMRNLADIVQWLERYLDGMSDSQRRAAISLLGLQEKSVTATLSIIGLSDKIRQYESRLMDAAGTTEEVAARQVDNFADKLKILWGRVEDVAISLGKTLIPALESLSKQAEGFISYLAELLEGFNKWDKSSRDLAIQLTLIAVAAGPLLVVLGKLLIVVKNLTFAFTAFLVALATNPIVLMTTVLAGLAVVVSGLLDDVQGLSTVGDDLFNRKASKWAGEMAKLEIQLRQAQVTAGKMTLEIQELEQQMSGFETEEDWLRLKNIEVRRRILTDVLAQIEAIREAMRQLAGEQEPGGAFSVADVFSSVGSAVQGLGTAAENGLLRLREGVIGGYQAIRDMAIEVESARDVFSEYALHIQMTAANMARDVVQGLDSIIGGFTRGIGDAVAQWAVYGESFGDLWKNLMNGLLAQLISTIVAMVAQWAIFWLLGVLGFEALATAAILASAKRGAAGVMASVAEVVPFPFSFAVAPGAGAGMFGLISSWAAFAKGGIVTGPTFGLMGEAGTEVILPLDRLEGMLGGARQTIIIEVDRRVIGQLSVEEMPAYLKMRLGNLI